MKEIKQIITICNTALGCPTVYMCDNEVVIKGYKILENRELFGKLNEDEELISIPKALLEKICNCK